MREQQTAVEGAAAVVEKATGGAEAEMITARLRRLVAGWGRKRGGAPSGLGRLVAGGGYGRKVATAAEDGGGRRGTGELVAALEVTSG